MTIITECEDGTPLKHGIVLFPEDLEVISLPEVLTLGFEVRIFSGTQMSQHHFRKYWSTSSNYDEFICLLESKSDMHYFLPIPFTCLLNRSQLVQGVSRYPLNISRCEKKNVHVHPILEKLMILQSFYSMPSKLNCPHFDALSNAIRNLESFRSKCNVLPSTVCQGRGLFVKEDVESGKF